MFDVETALGTQSLFLFYCEIVKVSCQRCAHTHTHTHTHTHMLHRYLTKPGGKNDRPGLLMHQKGEVGGVGEWRS